jgi:hypothetical protein
MEVNFMRPKQSRPGTDAYRERIVKHILSAHAGIFGAEVCQVCGELGTYRSLAGAYATHHWSHRSFICPLGHKAPHIKAALKRRERFCEVCEAEFRTKGHNQVCFYHCVCDGCIDEIKKTQPDREVCKVVIELTRRRYLDLECPTDEKLRAFDFMVQKMRFLLDEGWAAPPKPGLTGTKKARGHEVLGRLGEVHGRDYFAEKRQKLRGSSDSEN